MTLEDFCRAHGIMINGLPPIGIWKRYGTEDHPRSKNGAVKYMGTYAHVQNHATMLEPVTWQSESKEKIDPMKLARMVRAQDQQTQELQTKAAAKAAWIVNQCQFAKHEYLSAKGFSEEQGLVWLNDGIKLLVIPMRVNNRIVGCQLIGVDGGKKFLYGQRSAEAEMIIDNKGPHILCEGYATALSIKYALQNMKRRYTIHVCFSAGNMVKIAKSLDSGFVVADNDVSKTGERVAMQIGWPYWMSDVTSEDANDTHQRLGLFKFSQSLIKSMQIK